MIRRLVFIVALLATPAALPAQAAPAEDKAKPINKAEVSADLDADYADLDADKDGKASTTEIKARMKKGAERDLALIAKQRDAAFAKLDGNGDGSISRAEFDARAALPTLKEADATPVLSRFDTNKDGSITRDEFRAPTLANFDKMDLDKDGTLSSAELSAAAKKSATKEIPSFRR